MFSSKRQLKLIVVMGFIFFLVLSVIFVYLYKTNIDTQITRMSRMVETEARLIEAVAQYDFKAGTKSSGSGNSAHNTISQVIDAFATNYLVKQDNKMEESSFGILGKEKSYLFIQENDKIQISAKNYQHDSYESDADSVSVLSIDNKTHLLYLLDGTREENRIFINAYKSKSGTYQGADRYGNDVIAVYSYVPTIQHSLMIVANKDDLKTPFFLSFFYSLLGVLVLISIASYSYLKFIDKMFVKSENRKEKMKLLLNSTSEGIVGFDVEGNCTFSNQTAVELLGYSSEKEIESMNIGDFIYDDNQYLSANRIVLSEYFDNSNSSYINMVKKDKSFLKAEIRAHSMIVDGQNVGDVMSFTDGKVKLAEQARLKDSKFRYYQLFNEVKFGIAHVDFNGKIIEANHFFSIISGYKKEELEKSVVYDLFADINEEDFQNLVTHCIAQLKNDEVSQIKLNHKTKDEVWINMGMTLLTDSKGTPLNLICAIYDISDRVRSERKLIKAQEAHSQAEMITHFGNWDWDIVTGELTWTDEIYRIFGVEPQEFPATYEAFLKTIHPEDRESVIEAVNSSVEDANVPYNITHRVVRPSNEERIVQERGIVYRDQEGNPIRMIGTVHDITIQRIAEEQLHVYKNKLERLVEERTDALILAQEELIKQEKMATLGQLTATVSHELRNPLAAIKPSLYIVEKLIKEPNQKISSALERISRSVERCDNLVDELLDFTRSKELNIDTVNINTWLPEVIHELNLPDSVKVVYELKSRKRNIDLDKSIFSRVIINLVDNACQAMTEVADAEHILKIKTESKKGGVSVTISDNGPGMKDEVLERVFEPLYSTKGFGIGLGMAIVKQIVEQHHGEINIQSILNKGTDVEIFIPDKHVTEKVA
ncbi:MAG: PAS domain-containing protein [Gammaproteobacteria bacterium]|nr:PAS domain-containing protein [Gammaproteobacteria bacterium]MDH5630460.1 PAS domain-containing protein [Gammaproteobacteria bacterium]